MGKRAGKRPKLLQTIYSSRLGKGGVDSSILSGGTSIFFIDQKVLAATGDRRQFRTLQEHVVRLQGVYGENTGKGAGKFRFRSAVATPTMSRTGAAAKRIGGWKYLRMVERYAAVSDEHLETAVERLAAV